MSLNKIQEIIIVHPINRLKEKIRPKENIDVYLTKAQIEKANQVLAESNNLKEKEIDLLFANITSLWEKLKQEPSKDNHCYTMFFIYVNRLDDLSLIFSIEVMQNFIEGLKKFLNNAKIDNKTHQTIIQAYLDVISLSYKRKINSSNDPEAKQLQKMIDRAISQNS